VFKNKDHGKAAAVASLGLVSLWDVEGGLAGLDKYLYSTDPHVVAGALLGIGVLCCCVQNENDPGERRMGDRTFFFSRWRSLCLKNERPNKKKQKKTDKRHAPPFPPP